MTAFAKSVPYPCRHGDWSVAVTVIEDAGIPQTPYGLDELAAADTVIVPSIPDAFTEECGKRQAKLCTPFFDGSRKYFERPPRLVFPERSST